APAKSFVKSYSLSQFFRIRHTTTICYSVQTMVIASIESGLEVVPSDLPIAYTKEGADLPEAVPLTGHSDHTVHETSWLQRKLRMILLIAVAVVLLAAIIGGAVGGTLHNQNRSTPPASSTEVGQSNGSILPISLSTSTLIASSASTSA